MRILALSLALLLRCAPCQAQFDIPDGLDLDGLDDGGIVGDPTGGNEAVGGATCYTRNVQMPLGVCGSTTFQVGVCGDDEDGADEEFGYVQSIITTFVTQTTDEDCEASYAEICESADKVKAQGCALFCEKTQVSVVADFRGCEKDDECPVPEIKQPPCCDYMRRHFEDMCSYTDAELERFGRLDQKISNMFDATECANVDGPIGCYSASAQTAASVATSLVMGAMALVFIF